MMHLLVNGSVLFCKNLGGQQPRSPIPRAATGSYDIKWVMRRRGGRRRGGRENEEEGRGKVNEVVGGPEGG